MLPGGAAALARATQGLGFVLLALAVIAINRFFLAGLSAAQPHVVDDARLVTANSLATTLGTRLLRARAGHRGRRLDRADRHGLSTRTP